MQLNYLVSTFEAKWKFLISKKKQLKKNFAGPNDFFELACFDQGNV